MADGRWWISGGTYNKETSEILQPGNSIFEDFVDLPEGMHVHEMICVDEETVLFVGNEPPSEKVYTFNVQTETFTQLPDIPNARRGNFAGMKSIEVMQKLPSYLIF